MKCRTCQYDLWGIAPPGPCPECSSPFDPTTYQFHPNEARFHCPSCAAAYLGNGPGGLPWPRSFACVKCAAPVEVRLMPVRPAPGADAEKVVARAFPWPGKAGFKRIGAFFRTVGWSMTAPARLGANLPIDSGTFHAMRFAFWVSVLTGIPSAAAFAIMVFAFAPLAGSGASGGVATAVGSVGFALLGTGLGVVFLACPVWGALAHLVLLGGQPRGGFEQSLKCAWYALGPYAICAVPCLGFYVTPVALVWSTISMAFMLRAAHGVHGLRAAIAAMLLPMGAGALLTIAVAMPFIGLAGSGLLAAGPNVSTPSSLAGALQANAGPDGLAPSHILQAPPPYVFYSWELRLLGGMDVDLPDGAAVADLDTLTEEQRTALISAAGDGPFYLLGDFVLSHRGMNLSAPDPGLWIAFSDPRAGAGYPGMMTVHLASGTQDNLVGQWADLVSAQNVLRAAAGLPPIPEDQSQLPPRP